MLNPFQEINDRLDVLIQRVEKIEGIKQVPTRIPLRQFCEQRKISRPTVYAWAQRGLIALEKVSGRQYVKSDSVTIASKYERL